MPIVTLMHQTGAFQHYYEAKCGIFQVRTTGSITHDQLSKQTHKQWKKTRKKIKRRKNSSSLLLNFLTILAKYAALIDMKYLRNLGSLRNTLTKSELHT